MKTELETPKTIRLVEADPQHAELTRAALEEHHLANQVEVVPDRAPALDYWYCRGEFKTQGAGQPVVPPRARRNDALIPSGAAVPRE